MDGEQRKRRKLNLDFTKCVVCQEEDRKKKVFFLKNVNLGL